jgi:hypothetical protein
MKIENPARRDYSLEERKDRTFLRAAAHIRGLWEEKGSSDTRILDAFFLPDEFTVVGRSHNYNGKGRREHVVPRLVIIKECHAMLERGEDDKSIAKFIHDNVRIVLISKEEQESLDHRDQAALKQTMPDGWTFGGNAYARLQSANILWVWTHSTMSDETVKPID